MAAQVTLQEAANRAYLLATGKPGGIDLTSTKGLRILQLLNFYQRDWATDRTTEWHSLRRIFTLPSTVTATDTFSMSSLSSLNHLSKQEGDFVRIYATNGTDEYDYTVVEAALLYNDGRQLNNGGIGTYNTTGTCAMMGTSLVFSAPFTTTSPQFGGTIKVPGYSVPDDMVNATDTVAVDDAEWLETRVAAEYVRNDITRVQLYPSLMDQATDKLADMRDANEAQIERAYTGGNWMGHMGQNW